MCKWTTFYAGGEGYVVKCEECQYVQLGFGTAMLTFTREDFSVFVDLVAQRWAVYVPAGHDRKCIMLPTPAPFYKMLLTGDELHHLDRMLQLADSEMKTESLLGLFREG